MLAQDAIRYQQHDHRAIHDIAMLIHRKHAISIAIESGTEIGTYLEHLFLQRYKVLRLNGAWRVVREGTVQFKKEWDKLGRQVLKHARHYHSGHTITGIDHHFERS